ncbi:MAG: GNAT family N-acetyltransferase [Proteobacteria bacterium]|nr:GNAT family N-acetyltransferase [Pseudomonadota bacterium]
MATLLTLPAIETPNLVLREIRSADARYLASFMTQPRYQKHIAHRLKDDAAVQEFVRRQVAVQGDMRRQVYHLASEEKLSGEVVGEGFIIVHPGQGCEIGWGVHPAMWSMGLGTEIGRALLGLGFERMKAQNLWCKVMTANGASAAVAKHIGMQEVGKHADYAIGQGRFEPVIIFRITAAQYFDLPY